MAWYSVVLKAAFVTRKLTCTPGCHSYLLRFPIQAAMNEVHIQYLVTLSDPLSPSRKKSNAWQGSAVSCSDYSLHSG